MFRITEDATSGNFVQCLSKNYKNGSIASVVMDKVGVIVASVHGNRYDRTILVTFNQALYKVP